MAVFIFIIKNFFFKSSSGTAICGPLNELCDPNANAVHVLSLSNNRSLTTRIKKKSHPKRNSGPPSLHHVTLIILLLLLLLTLRFTEKGDHIIPLSLSRCATHIRSYCSRERRVVLWLWCDSARLITLLLSVRIYMLLLSLFLLFLFYRIFQR